MAEDGSSLMRTATWTLVNFLKGSQNPRLEKVEIICQTLSQMIQRTQQSSVMVECLEGMAVFLDDHGEAQLNVGFAQPGLIDMLIALLQHNDDGHANKI